MARPRKTTPKAAPCAVSLYPHEREAFRALGGSRFLRLCIATALAEADGRMPLFSTKLRVHGADQAGVTLCDVASGSMLGPYRTGDHFIVDVVAPVLPVPVRSPPKRP